MCVGVDLTRFTVGDRSRSIINDIQFDPEVSMHSRRGERVLEGGEVLADQVVRDNPGGSMWALRQAEKRCTSIPTVLKYFDSL